MKFEEVKKRKEELDILLEGKAEIYLIKCEQYHKIGFSTNSWQRFNDLNGTGMPFKLELVYYGFMDDARKLEKDMHKKFVDKRVKGEWFELTDEDIREFKEICDKHLL